MQAEQRSGRNYLLTRLAHRILADYLINPSGTNQQTRSNTNKLLLGRDFIHLSPCPQVNLARTAAKQGRESCECHAVHADERNALNRHKDAFQTKNPERWMYVTHPTSDIREREPSSSLSQRPRRGPGHTRIRGQSLLGAASTS